MPHQTVVRVDQEQLGVVLDAIREDAAVEKELCVRGSPSNPLRGLRGGNREIDWRTDLRCEELRACIDDDNAWRVDDKYAHQLAQRVAYRLLADGEEVDSVAEFIETSLSVEVETFTIALEVLGLETGDQVIELGEASIGRLALLLEREGLSIDREARDHKDPDPAETVAVLVQVDAPESLKATEPAAHRASEHLDLLATTAFRTRFNHGPPWNIRLGRSRWKWPEGETETIAGLSNHWLRGVSYRVERSTLDADDDRFAARADAWSALPAGELRQDLRRAYVSIGAAARRVPDAHASVSRAWTAIETVFCAGQQAKVGRAPRAVANRFKLAYMAGTGTTHPGEIAEFYFLRNDLVHEAVSWQWNSKDGMNRLWPLYRHLDHLAAYCLREGIGDRATLEAHFQEPEVVSETVKWLKSWVEPIEYKRNHAVLPDLERRYGEARKFYGKVVKAC